MSNLRSSDLRTRDIRKLVNFKSQEISWDKGCDETSEWVLASLENEAYRERLKAWLLSKNISPENQGLKIDSGWKEPKRVSWEEFLLTPEVHFGKEMFEVYDIDLKWVMEYQPQEIVRFGRYK